MIAGTLRQLAQLIRERADAARRMASLDDRIAAVIEALAAAPSATDEPGDPDPETQRPPSLLRARAAQLAREHQLPRQGPR